ncbi:MAG: hypothetical protein V4481_01045 [Patescibacteria group bacterium]
MKANEVVIFHDYGLIHKGLRRLYGKDLVGGTKSRKNWGTALMFIGFLCGGLGIGLSAGDFFRIAFVPVLIAFVCAASGTIMSSWNCRLGKHLDELRCLLCLEWFVFLSVDIEEIKKKADQKLRYLAARMRRVEKRFNTPSSEAESAFEDFVSAHELCCMFNLVEPKRNGYIDGWEQVEFDESKDPLLRTSPLPEPRPTTLSNGCMAS